MAEEKKNSFQILNNVNLGAKVKQKIGLSYLSWADAWSELKKYYPDATMTVYTHDVETTDVTEIIEDGVKHTITTKTVTPLPYFSDGKTCYVKVGVTVEGVEYFEIYPVMDNRNNAVATSLITMTAVNKAIQRAFVKACARHGLGLYIYSGEDLPESERKVIDFKAMADNCNRYQTVVLTQEGFEKMRGDVIQAVQEAYPEEASKALMNYVQSCLNGKRISLTDLEHDSQNIQRIYYFINELKKQLAASND